MHVSTFIISVLLLETQEYPPMPEITISEVGVLALLKKIDPRKASGADKIPGAFLKECVHEIAPMLSVIIQKSLDEKNVLVSPVFKKGDRSKPENYRPISLTLSHLLQTLRAHHSSS